MFNTEDEILRRLQEKNLEMAVMFYHWCQRNHLTCYLCGGGCIGAIRHGGFIPWDDDLDFFMPRKDYEKFLKIWDTQEESKIEYLEEKGKKQSLKLYLVSHGDRYGGSQCVPTGSICVPCKKV